MKKRQVVGLVVAGLLAGFVSHAVAQSATAYSSSAIGVIKKTIPAQKLVLVSVPLDQESDEGQGFPFQSIAAISNMPNGSVANFWDATNQEWIPQSKSAKGGWGAQKNRLIAPGECFFLYNPQTSDIELIVSGEVPADDSIARAIPAGALQVVANPYPVSMAFTNFTFASAVPNGSVANFWDVENQEWVPQSKSAKGGWGAQKARVIAPGEGFFVLPAANSTATTWTESRPYTWPN
jgi:hypothetical protein